jgi:hypothetical protein
MKYDQRFSGIAWTGTLLLAVFGVLGVFAFGSSVLYGGPIMPPLTGAATLAGAFSVVGAFLLAGLGRRMPLRPRRVLAVALLFCAGAFCAARLAESGGSWRPVHLVDFLGAPTLRTFDIIDP